MLEKAVFFSEYNNINITGETSKFITPALLLICVVKIERFSIDCWKYM